jgi:hypothetical protein
MELAFVVNNPNIDWDTICKVEDLYNNKQHIRLNTSITSDVIITNKKILNKYLIVANENYPINEIEFNSMFTTFIIFIDAYLENPNILPHIIKLYNDNPTTLINCTTNSVFASIAISANIGLTWELINSMKLNWNFAILSAHSAITWEIVQKNPHLQWNFKNLSRNINITWDIVKDNPDKDWSYELLPINPNITWEIIQENPNKPWVIGNYLENPNVTFKFMEENIHLFKQDELKLFSRNHMNRHKYFTSSIYKKRATKNLHSVIYCELIERTCTPARIFQWNEGAAEEYPEEYLKECAKYR